MPILKATNQDASDFVVLDEDTYPAIYTHCNDFEGGQFGPALKLYFQVSYADEKNVKQTTEVTGIAGLPAKGAMGGKSKLRSWIEALLGRPMADGEQVDLDKLENTPCRLVLGIKEGAVREDGTKSRFNRIEKVLPPKKRTTQAAVDDGDVI